MGAFPYLRAFFALLLLAAGLSKLLDLDGFYAIVEDYKFLPWALIIPGALVMIATEIGLAAWLISGRALLPAALNVLLLHWVYLGWISIAAMRGLEIENCGCFGAFWARPLSVWTFVEEGVLLLLASWFVITARRAGPQSWAGASRPVR